MVANEDVERLCDRAATAPERVLTDLGECIRLAGPSQQDADRVAVCDAIGDARVAVQPPSYPSLSAAEFGEHLTALRAMVRAIDCQDDWNPTNTQVVVRLFKTILGMGEAHLEAIRPHSAAVSHLLGECLHLLNPVHPAPDREAMASIMYSIHYPSESPSLLAIPVFRDYLDQVRDVLRAIDHSDQTGRVYESVISELFALLGDIATTDPDAMLSLATDYQHLIGGAGESDVSSRLGFFQPIVKHHPEAFLPSLPALIGYASIGDACSADAARTALPIAQIAPDRFVEIAAADASFQRRYPDNLGYKSDTWMELEDIYEENNR